MSLDLLGVVVGPWSGKLSLHLDRLAHSSEVHHTRCRLPSAFIYQPPSIVGSSVHAPALRQLPPEPSFSRKEILPGDCASRKSGCSARKTQFWQFSNHNKSRKLQNTAQRCTMRCAHALSNPTCSLRYCFVKFVQYSHRSDGSLRKTQF